MMRSAVLAGFLILSALSPMPAAPCEDPGTQIACGDANAARWLLNRAAAAVEIDKTEALNKFVSGADGYRTSDTYVFCISLDGVMAAHPNPILRGHNVRDLHDRTGNYFIRAMLQEAKPGEISTIHYLFPKPGSTVEEPKTTFYTRAGDLMCGVGVYDADTRAVSGGTAPDTRVAELRRKLDAQIPASARADWIAFLEALNARSDARRAAFSRVRRSLQEAEAAFAQVGSRPEAE